ncbi:MAG: hypothetical protein ACKO7B_19665, partial [Flavobacteriales bacterium]
MTKKESNTLKVTSQNEAVLRIDERRAAEFLKALDSRPKERWAFVYQAIIVSLIAHIFILFVTQMLTEDHRVQEEELIYEE